MNVLRWAARGLLMLLASTCLTLWLGLMVMQFSLLNRTVVFGWLDQSGAYSNLIDAIFSLQLQPGSEQTLDATSLQQAVKNTLTPAYIKDTTQTILGATYDWIEGKTNAISFKIDVAEKRTQLQQELVRVIEPKLAALPTCNSNMSGLTLSGTQCLPKGANVTSIAEGLADDVIKNSNFLSEPITAQSLTNPATGSWLPPAEGLTDLPLNWLPGVVQNLPWLLFGLPVLAAGLVAAYVGLSDDKLKGLRAVSGRVLFGSVLGALGAGAVWYFGSSLTVTEGLTDDSQLKLLQEVVEPILRQVAAGVGFWWLIFAAAVAIVSASIWITAIILGRKHRPKAAEPKTNNSQHEEPAAAQDKLEPAPITHQPEASKPTHQTTSVGRM